MKIRKLFAVSCVVSLLGDTVQAAPPTNVTEAIAAIEADSVLVSHWISNEFAHAVPFNSTSGNVVPKQLKLFGFDIGVSAVVSSTEMDTDAFRNLGTTVVDTREIDTYDRLPMPMLLGHAKIGLPWGLDAGVRLGGIPSTDSDEGDTHMEVSNTVFGLDLRKKLIEEGITRPFGLTLGVNYTHAKGHVSATTPYSPEAGSGVTFSDDTMGSVRSDWSTDSVGLQAILNKKIVFINPYVGASINKNFGDIETTIRNTGTATHSAVSQSFDTVGISTVEADDTDMRGLLGLEFTLLPFMKLGLQGEFANEGKTAASFGLRIQFH